MKTLLGYQDKNRGQYKIIEKKLPLLVDERYEPFLISTRQFFNIGTYQIVRELQTIPIREGVRKIKNILSAILIVPGTISAVLYILNFLTALVSTDPIPLYIPVWLTNFTFWLAILGATLLWHETYRTYHISSRILESDYFSDHDIKNIKNGEFGISKVELCPILDITDMETKKVLSASCKKNEVNYFYMLDLLLGKKDCQKILRKLDIPDFEEKMQENSINEKSMPKYNISSLRSFFVYATEEAVLSKSSRIYPEHLFIALFKVFPVLDMYLKRNKLNTDLMRNVVTWIEIKQQQMKSTRIFDPEVPYFKNGGIANAWIYGYTFILGHYSKDLTQEIAKKGGHYGIGHEKEVDEALAVLGKVTKHNVLLIGESGTGKTSLVKAIAERISKATVPENMRDMRIIQLDVNGLIAAAPRYGNLETLVQQTMDELQRSGNTILYIDEIQEIVPAKGQESQHSLAGILLPYILESKFPLIGTITYADYKKYFYAKESLRQSFQNIEISEITPEAAFEIFLTRLDELQNTYHIDITFPAILSAVELAQRYVYDRKLPDSAVNIMESACAALQNTGGNKLTPADVAHTVSTQTEIPVENVNVDEATKLLNLEANIRAKVIGQDQAVHQIVEALKRARAGTRDIKRPIGTFLFLGPTGVGKTYVAKVISDEYFGKEHELIRLDMSEFKEIKSIERMLGTTENSEMGQTAITFLDQVKNDPYAVVLLDEIEKAHPQVLDLFLQVLDDGRMTNAAGETINFSNTIIIATSNIGSKTLLDALENDKAMFEEAKDRVLMELRQKVKVEFLNRFDKIIVFSPHDQENLSKIAELLLKELKSRLIEKEITLQWDDNIPKLIAQRSYEPGLGARPQRRYIQEKIEGVVATKILENQLKPGDTFAVSAEVLE